MMKMVAPEVDFTGANMSDALMDRSVLVGREFHGCDPESRGVDVERHGGGNRGERRFLGRAFGSEDAAKVV